LITVHHLADSRSQRILWLMEELELPYRIVHHPRHQGNLADPALKALHPLGKAPVITDGNRTIAESGAIIEYILETQAGGRLRPSVGGDDWVRYLQWMHLVEGSVMLPLVLGIYMGLLGEPGAALQPRVQGEIALHLGFIEDELKDREFIVGTALTGADIQLTFILEAAIAAGQLHGYPVANAYVARMQARPAYRRALERGGPYDLRRLHRPPSA
jgi:glutathione S-transferase